MLASSTGRLLASAVLAFSVPAVAGTAYAESFEGVAVTIDDVAFIGADELVNVSGTYRCAGLTDGSVISGSVTQDQHVKGVASGVVSVAVSQCDGEWHPFESTSFGQLGFFRPGPAVVRIEHLSCTPWCEPVPADVWVQDVTLRPAR